MQRRPGGPNTSSKTTELLPVVQQPTTVHWSLCSARGSFATLCTGFLTATFLRVLLKVSDTSWLLGLTQLLLGFDARASAGRNANRAPLSLRIRLMGLRERATRSGSDCKYNVTHACILRHCKRPTLAAHAPPITSSNKLSRYLRAGCTRALMALYSRSKLDKQDTTILSN